MPPAWPTHGVLPGCAWAGTLVKVYYLTALDALTARHPRIELDVYVDDIQIAAQGTDSAVVDWLAEASLDFNDVVEKEIQSKLVPAKAAVVASTAKLAKRVCAALGSSAGATVDVTEALGVDFAAGRTRREHGAQQPDSRPHPDWPKGVGDYAYCRSSGEGQPRSW